VKNGFSPKMTSHARATYFKRCDAAFWDRRYLHWLSITIWSRVMADHNFKSQDRGFCGC